MKRFLLVVIGLAIALATIIVGGIMLAYVNFTEWLGWVIYLGILTPIFLIGCGILYDGATRGPDHEG